MRHISFAGFFAVFALGYGFCLQSLGHSVIDKKMTLQKIRTYCQACHGVDELRFIKSDNDEELWQTLFTEYSPKTGKLWVDGIISVLSWPENEPPPFDQPMSSQGDWMPKGYKRIQLSKDVVNGVPTREIILDTLKRGGMASP